MRYLEDLSKGRRVRRRRVTYRMKSWTWFWIRTRNLSRSPSPDEGDSQPPPAESDKKAPIFSPQSSRCSQAFRVPGHPSRTVHCRRSSPRQGWRTRQAPGALAAFFTFSPVNHLPRELPTKAHFVRPAVLALWTVLVITRT